MLKKYLKPAYYGAFSFLRIDKLKSRHLVKKRQMAVLNLHRVSPRPSEYWPPLHPDVFDALLRYLDRHFEVRSFAELNEKQSSRPIAVLSFDDGYYDFIEYALPVIEKYKMPSNMNVIPQCAETGRPIWNVRLYDFLASVPRKIINDLQIEGFEQKMEGDDESSKLRFGMAISKFLKNRPRAERERLFSPLDRLIEDGGSCGTRMIRTDELCQISDMVELGAHSYSHESMGFEEQSFFEEDVSKCRDFFNQHFNKPLSIYAFPNGSYRPEQIDHLRRENIKKVLLVEEEFADIGSDVVKRITMYGDSPSEVKMRAVSG